ncbi:ladderlectin-like [Xiphophorus couchianus]|uniref:C-type lectin domain-containing protein n=1 Tax=Xiphophorus couchianus TaxID=32473 RepID=A0A3B5LQU5_9TELE|nr:ladderlectin-like [Xiphophorus couchianus]
MVTLNVLMFLCALTALSQAAATNDLLRSSCPAGWRKFNNRCFIYIPRTMTWARAQRNCVSLQATLASIHSFQEYHYIQRLITTATHGSPQTWIGGSDAQEEGVWLWSDGSPFLYSNWCRGEPNNYMNQHCLQMNYGESKCWDDFQCDQHRPSVCAKNI